MIQIDVSKFKKTEFAANDKFGFPGIGDFVLNTIKEYREHSRIESFVLLHGSIELIMFNVWGLFLMKTLGKEFRSLENFWDFKTSIILLEQVNLLNPSTKSKLLAFKKGRDTVSHLMTNKFHKKKIDEKILDDQFKKGISAYKDIIVVRKKLILELKKSKI